jgi:hypothetical protein
MKINLIILKASRAHVLKAATDYIRLIKTKNHQHQKSIEELKKQNASIELQSNLTEFLTNFFSIFLFSSSS